jgi:hypothetical protein
MKPSEHLAGGLVERYRLVGARFTERTGRPPLPVEMGDLQGVASAIQSMSAVLNGRADLDAGPVVETRVTGIEIEATAVRAHAQGFDAEGRRARHATVQLDGPMVEGAAAILRREAVQRARGLWKPT